MTILLGPLAVAAGSPASSNAGRTPVLIELFTSEGCSSCPPADRLLQMLEERQPVAGVDIIVLSEHVDYWDQLGWRDPFSSSQFTGRQRAYAETLRGEGVYTPQMVVDGKSGFVGNKPEVALKEIGKQAGRAVATLRFDRIALDGGSLTASVSVKDIPSAAGKGPFDVLVAATESGLRSKPGAGENQGAALSHTGVVRVLMRAGKPASSSALEDFHGEVRLKLDGSWNRDALKLVGFLQDRGTHAVWGAVQQPVR